MQTTKTKNFSRYTNNYFVRNRKEYLCRYRKMNLSLTFCLQGGIKNDINKI